MPDSLYAHNGTRDDELPKGSGRPRLPGIGNAVDRDRFNGTAKQLAGALLA